MHTWKEVVENHIIKHSDKVKKVTKPLSDHFGIRYFTFHRIDSSGNYSCLVNRPDYAEMYVENKIYDNDVFHDLPNMFQSGTCLWSCEPLKNMIDSGRGIMLIQKDEHEVLFYGFSTNTNSSAIETLAMNYPQILQSFTAYFSHELKSELIEMNAANFNLHQLSDKKSLAKAPRDPDIALATLNSYYNDLGLARELQMSQKLSTRERECLLLLLDGKTSKETAIQLGLKPRTVEFYFENIKNKLLCWNKQEVFTLAKRLVDLGLLQKTRLTR